jgi:hypothetical protein
MLGGQLQEAAGLVQGQEAGALLTKRSGVLYTPCIQGSTR